MIIGYTQGTFDMFHIGHLNLLRKASTMCDYLIVGVNSDDLVKSYKNKQVIINQTDRIEIINELRCVDKVILTESLDKNYYWQKYKFNKIFIGSDWKCNERWKSTEIEMRQRNVEVVWIPYTNGISSSVLRSRLKSVEK